MLLQHVSTWVVESPKPVSKSDDGNVSVICESAI